MAAKRVCLCLCVVLGILLFPLSTTGAPARGNLVIDTGSTPIINLDPVRFRSNTEKNVLSLAYESLTRYDNSMRIAPGLAESWRVEADRVTWTLSLRRGVRFQDGTPFNAQAAKFNLDRVIEPRSLSLQRPTFGQSIESVAALDAFTLQIRTRGVLAALPQLLAGWGGEMACPERVRSQGEEFNRRPCGTGPYQMEEFAPRDRIVFARFAGYWGEAGRTPRIVVRTIPEETTRIAALVSGQTHVMLGVPPRQVSFLRRDPRFRLTDNRSVAMEYIAFNLAAKPFDDRRVRVAVAHAINVDDIVRRVYDGNVVPFAGGVQPSLQGYDPTVRPYPHDVAKARQLLREAGQENLKVSFAYTDNPVLVRLAEVLQAQTREAGIDLTPQRWEFAAYLPMLVRGGYQMAMWGFGNSSGDPYFTLHLLLRSTSPPFTNIARYKNPAVDETLDGIRGELDPARRARLISRVTRINAADASHILFLSPRNNIAHAA
ncbi:MAG: hypothetical protein HY660_08950, partial [Armatimonadetes bacterium]|nr:hypothetical protein [Armatimonadota bacterium]